MYVDDDKLYLVCDVTFEDTKVSSNDEFYDFLHFYNKTYIYTFDISDVEDVELDSEVNQEGSYMTSRLVGGYIYSFTYKTLYDFTEERCVPRVNDNYVQPQNVYISEYVDSTSYVVVSSIDTNKPEKIKKSIALLADYADFYVSKNNIYILEDSYEEDDAANKTVGFKNTHITKVNYNKGKIKVVAEKAYKGSVKNSDSIDEYDGSLRVVLSYDDIISHKRIGSDTYNFTKRERDNVLIILDEKLNQLGKYAGIAPDEQVKSVRFLGKIAYVVTFRNTDPLFAFDLSDKKHPKLLGALEVPGYSDYLYSWDKKHLIGIGVDIDEFGYSRGKISMFDVSDPLHMEEVHKYVIPNCDWSQYNTAYKSLLLDKEKNIIGVASRRQNYNTRYTYSHVYSFYKYDDVDGFTLLMDNDFTYDPNVDRSLETNNSTYETYVGDVIDNERINDFNNVRGMYIGSNAYVIVPNSKVEVYSLNSFEKLAQISTEYLTDEELESIKEAETETETETESETETETKKKKSKRKRSRRQSETSLEDLIGPTVEISE